MSERRVPEVVFLGEQDGAPERDLKAFLIQWFETEPKVERAYLARVQYGQHGELAVALCICATGHEEAIGVAVAAIFKRLFRTDTFLDVLFLDDKMEARLEPVCPCFFAAGQAPNR